MIINLLPARQNQLSLLLLVVLEPPLEPGLVRPSVHAPPAHLVVLELPHVHPLLRKVPQPSFPVLLALYELPTIFELSSHVRPFPMDLVVLELPIVVFIRIPLVTAHP